MTGFTLSVATLSEAPIVHRLMLAAFKEYESVLEVPSSALSESAADCALTMSRGGAVLAWQGEEPVGSGRYQLLGSHAYFERISVLREWRGIGVAAALLAEMERLAVDAGYTEGRLSVRLALPRNLALYTRLGYQVYEERQHPKGTERIADLKKQLIPDASGEPVG